MKKNNLLILLPIFMISILFIGCPIQTDSKSSGSGGGSKGGGSGMGNPTPSGWVQLGSQVSPSTAESEDPSMLMIGSTPAVGYRHESYRTYLNVWNGTDWGSPKADPTGNNTKSSIYSTPDFCSDGSNIYMTYSDDSSSYDQIFVYKWNQSTSWTIQNSGDEVSIPYSGSPPSASAYEPAIACVPSGNPHVAWVEWNAPAVSDDDAWVAEVTGSSVTRSSPLSRNNSTGSYATDVRTVGITVDGSGNSYLAQWEQHHNNQYRTDLYVSRYNGSFTSLGGSISADYDSNNLSVPSLAVISSDLYVAYSEANSSDYTKHIYVKKYSGGVWSLVGGGPVSAFSTSDHYDSANPDLLVVNGTLYLAWEESDLYDGPFVYVAYWNTSSGSWNIIGDKLNVDVSRSALDPSLAYSAADNYLYVAFEELVSGWPQIFVKRKTL